MSEEERRNREELQIHTCDLVLYMPLQALELEKDGFANDPKSIQEIVSKIEERLQLSQRGRKARICHPAGLHPRGEGLPGTRGD